MLKFGDDKGQLKCSFCGKTQEQVKKLAAVLNVVQPAMYTEEEYREMAEYRRRKDDQKRMAD
jgi:hypothetical protein